MDTQISPSQIAKGRSMLARLVEEKQMSLEGKLWLTFALDPFHDKEIKGITGVPDGNTGKSVVCSLVQEIQIRKPSTLGAGNWSCRIATYPVASSFALTAGRCSNNLVNVIPLGPGPPVPRIAPVVIDYALDGNDFAEFPLNPDVLEIPAQYTKGPYKVGAMGVESVNTTADIYRQGLVTCARMNQTSCTPTTFQEFNNSAALYTFIECVPIRTAPVNLAQMVLLTGNTAWKAAEGAYSVVSLKSLNDTNATSKPVFPLMLSSDFQSNDVATIIPCAGPQLSLIPVPGLGIPTNPPLLTTQGFPGQVPMDTSIQMYTGLSDQTTLTVRVRWMLERFPNDVESDIVVLASESASYDPIALSIYSQVMQSLPAAVMFKENPKGEWWKTVLGTIADVVGSGLMAAPHPAAKAAGAAMLLANKTFNSDNATLKPTADYSNSVERSASKKAKKKKKNKNLPQSGTIQVYNTPPPLPPRRH